MFAKHSRPWRGSRKRQGHRLVLKNKGAHRRKPEEVGGFVAAGVVDRGVRHQNEAGVDNGIEERGFVHPAPLLPVLVIGVGDLQVG